MAAAARDSDDISPPAAPAGRDLSQPAAPRGSGERLRSARPVAGISVREALELPSLAGATLRAGARGLQRTIRSVNMMEVPDIERWLREDELLVTTAYPLGSRPEALLDLVRALNRRSVAALALKPNRYVEAPSATVLALADQLAMPLIELDGESSFNDILADVLGTILNRQAVRLERSRAANERLTGVVLAGGGLPELVATLAQLTGADAAIVGADGELLAASGEPSELDAAGMVRMTHTIRAGGIDHGTLLVWTRDPVVPNETVMAIEQARTIAALALVHTRAVASRAKGSRVRLVEELLSGRPLNVTEVLARARGFGWDLTVPRAALDVLLTRDEAAAERRSSQPGEDELVDLLRELAGPGAIAWGLAAGLAALVVDDPRGRIEGLPGRLRDAIEQRWPATRAAVAVGRAYTDPLDLHKSQREASRSLALGQQLYGTSFAVSHDDLAIYRLLDEVPVETLEDFCAGTLGQLVDFDRRNHASLLETLEAYFSNARNRADAARALYVHYNTLRHRMDRIESLLGGLHSDPHRLLTLELAFHARRFLAAQGRALQSL